MKVILAALLLLLATSLNAQTPTDTTKRNILGPTIFVTGLTLGLVATEVWDIDEDKGGYDDGWDTKLPFSDKAWHAAGCWMLTNVGIDLKLKPWKAAVITFAGAVVFEFAQGYVSPYDIGADAIGCGGAAAWRMITK